jgi:ParB family chromosome partitioning protein
MAKMKKNELGKGIRALLSSADDAAPEQKDKLIKELSKSIAEIPLDSIEINPFQPRSEFDVYALEQLAKSIKMHGLVQPITVRHLGDGNYQIISGERRVRAGRMIGLKEIPAYIRLADDQAMLEMALIENIQRKDLNPLEIAFSYQRLMTECDITHEEVAERVSKKRSTVSNYLRLLRLPPVVQHAVREEKISMGHARAIAGLDDFSTQREFLELTLNKNWSVRQLESTIQDYKAPPRRPNRSVTGDIDADIKSLQDELSAAFGTKVSLSAGKSGKGKMVIHFDDHDELQQIINLIRSVE